jgi:hypothetical protein
MKNALGHHELERVYIAGTLAEAKEVEALLTGHGVDYIVQVEEYRSSILFGPRNGAAFYVTDVQATFCRAQLTTAGLDRGVLHD